MRDEKVKPKQPQRFTSMSDTKSTQSETAVGHPGKTTALRRQWPYLAVLTLAIAGVAYTNISQKPLVGYWEFLALATGALCVVTQWPEADDKKARFQLMWTQGLHWVAVLVTMNIILLASVQQILPSPATSLVLLMLLALGTFLAGLNFLSLPLCLLGIAMAFSVPAIAWLKLSVLFLVLVVVLLIGLAMVFWPRGAGASRAAK
jgi:hypothetical protein